MFAWTSLKIRITWSVQWTKNGLLLLLLSRFSRVRLCATPETAAHQAPPSLGFFRQEHWSGLPFTSPVHESESEVAQSCPTLSNPKDCSLPGAVSVFKYNEGISMYAPVSLTLPMDDWNPGWITTWTNKSKYSLERSWYSKEGTGKGLLPFFFL